MNKKSLNVLFMAAFLVLAVGGFYYLAAQMGGGPGGGQREDEGQGPGMRRPPMGMMGGGMGGGAAMVVHGNFIYVLSGQTLMKIEPSALKIVKELSLRPKMGPGGGQGRQGQMPPEDEE